MNTICFINSYIYSFLQYYLPKAKNKFLTAINWITEKKTRNKEIDYDKNILLKEVMLHKTFATTITAKFLKMLKSHKMEFNESFTSKTDLQMRTLPHMVFQIGFT